MRARTCALDLTSSNSAIVSESLQRVYYSDVVSVTIEACALHTQCMYRHMYNACKYTVPES
jgi:hypothetical protein